jgi:hypothetical protein
VGNICTRTHIAEITRMAYIVAAPGANEYQDDAEDEQGAAADSANPVEDFDPGKVAHFYHPFPRIHTETVGFCFFPRLCVRHIIYYSSSLEGMIFMDPWELP